MTDGSRSTATNGGRSVGPCETFGVTEILSGRLRDGCATADSEAVTLAIEAEDFFDLLSNNVDIVKALFREVLAAGATNGDAPATGGAQ